MNKILPPLAIVCLSFTSAFADQHDLEARKASIPVLENHIRERESQRTELANDVLGLHARIDAKLNRTVQRFTGIKDSAKSGYRISKAKLELIDGLQKAVEAYQSRRNDVFQKIRRADSPIPKKVRIGEVEHFDHHIEQHIEQMLKISKSFTQDEDVEKYELDSGGGTYDGFWGWESSRISDEYRQNRRDRIMDGKQRDEVTKALKNSANRCESLISGLREELKSKKLPAADRELIQDELKKHSAMRENRQQQLEDLLVIRQPETTAVNRDTAEELTESLEDLVADVQRDLQMIFLKHSQLEQENTKLYRLKRNLEARKQWLKEHDSDSPASPKENG